jgi:hypothetical protein
MDRVLSEYRRCRPWILRALKHSDTTEAEILEGLTTFHMQIWAGEHCVVITQDERDTGSLFITIIAGDNKAMREFKDKIEPQIVGWSRSLRKTRLYGKGRKGWVRHAKKFGWTIEGVEPDGVIVGRFL